MFQDDRLNDWLETVSEKVQRNVTPVSEEELAQSFLLHISTNTTLRKFVPLIGRRQAPSEDRTVPRVCVCPTLLGCMIGYASLEHDFTTQIPDGKGETKYKGGWNIYAFDLPSNVAALKPNKKLVFDQEVSDEHWLVSYSPETTQYTATVAGKCFVRSISLVGRSSKTPIGEMELYVDVRRDSGIHFSQNIYLNKGFWVITGPVPKNVKSWTHDKDYQVRELSREEFTSIKQASADLLSYKEPVWANW